jgi:hypothetical protein
LVYFVFTPKTLTLKGLILIYHTLRERLIPVEYFRSYHSKDAKPFEDFSKILAWAAQFGFLQPLLACPQRLEVRNILPLAQKFKTCRLPKLAFYR